MLGAEQEAWLADGLAHSRARWNVIAQDVLMAQFKEKNENPDRRQPCDTKYHFHPP